MTEVTSPDFIPSFIKSTVVKTNVPAPADYNDIQNIVVAFSPQGGITQMIVDSLNSAKVSLLVQAYELTSEPIVAAIIAAKKRGVTVDVVLDKTMRTGGGTKIKELDAADIPYCFDDHVHIAHNKVIVIDATYVVTGSFNFSNNAEFNNAENCMVITSEAIASQYRTNFMLRKAISNPLVVVKPHIAMSEPIQQVSSAPNSPAPAPNSPAPAPAPAPTSPIPVAEEPKVIIPVVPSLIPNVVGIASSDTSSGSILNTTSSEITESSIKTVPQLVR